MVVTKKQKYTYQTQNKHEDSKSQKSKLSLWFKIVYDDPSHLPEQPALRRKFQ